MLLYKLFLIMKKENKLKYQGWRDGFEDQNNGLIKTELNEQQFGEIYVKAYSEGYERAKNGTWYIVSLDKENKINSWLNDDLPQHWVKDKSSAKKFVTKEIADARLNQLQNAVGRGSYSVVWRLYESI